MPEEKTITPAQRQGTMVFHTPYPLQDKPVAASALRPVKMRQAFETLGYDVIEITGYAKQRKAAIKRLLSEMKAGREIDFVYSESATIPNSFTEKKHFPLHLLLDRGFFRAMKQAGVPVGVFYRDVYWAFPEYVANVGRLVSIPMKMLYRWDLDSYSRYLKALFVPSMGYLDSIRDQVRLEVDELPPAGDYAGNPINLLEEGERLELFYVGGINRQLYNLDLLVDVVESRNDVALTLCVPEQQWTEFVAGRGNPVRDNINVVHTRGEGLEPHYAKAHVCTLYMPPGDYRDFAVPVKMYEYLAHSRPVLATKGSFAAQFVAEKGLGWSLPFGEDALNDFLDRLVTNPSVLVEKAEAAKVFGEKNQWADRAAVAAGYLMR